MNIRLKFNHKKYLFILIIYYKDTLLKKKKFTLRDALIMIKERS